MLAWKALPRWWDGIGESLARRVNDGMILRLLIVLVVAELAILRSQSNKTNLVQAKFLK